MYPVTFAAEGTGPVFYGCGVCAEERVTTNVHVLSPQAFALLLVADLTVGYHSSDGWVTFLEMFYGRYTLTEPEDAEVRSVVESAQRTRQGRSLRREGALPCRCPCSTLTGPPPCLRARAPCRTRSGYLLRRCL